MRNYYSSFINNYNIDNKSCKIYKNKTLAIISRCHIRMMMKMMKMMMMMNCFCGMVDRRKVFSLISSRDHCQRSSPSRISDTPQAGFEPAKNLSSGSVEGSFAVVITTAPLPEISFIILRPIDRF